MMTWNGIIRVSSTMMKQKFLKRKSNLAKIYPLKELVNSWRITTAVTTTRLLRNQYRMGDSLKSLTYPPR